MNNDQVEGTLKKWMGDVKAKWGDLTDDEVMEAKGNAEKLAGVVQAKYGKTKEEAEKEVQEFMDSKKDEM